MEENGGACCRDQTKMVQCAVMALEKMKEMFGAALGTVEDPSCEPATAAAVCAIDSACPLRACPFLGTGEASNALQTFCANTNQLKPNGRSDRNAMRLLPDEVGLRGDQATFHLSRRADRSVPVAEDGRLTGAVYYNVCPAAAASASPETSDDKPQQRKHVVQALPPMRASTKPVVGPVTGLPVGDNEHVVVLRLCKRGDEPDVKARLQIEMRLPKHERPALTDVGMQCLATDVMTVVEPKKKKKKMMKKKKMKKKKKKKSNKKDVAKQTSGSKKGEK